MKFMVQNSASFCVKEKRACIKWVERYFKDCLCNTKDELSFGFGVISLVFWGVAEIPQIVTNFRTKSSHGVSLLFLSAWIVGDVFNLVGCLLEPATLPTQFYTALLYTTSTVILVLQSLYYDYLPKGTSTQENEKHQEVEEVKKPLIQQKRSDSSVPIAEVCYNMSTVDNNESSFDDEANRMLEKKCVSRSRPIPRTVVQAALLALSIRKPRLTLASMQVYVGSDGLKLIQRNGEESAYGEWLGWMMAAIYICGRLPQIWLNVKRGNVEGLSPLMFIFTLAANATYVASILVRSIAWDEIKSNMPWLLDAVGCVVLDLFIILQYVHYRYSNKRSCCSREELISYCIEANKD